MKKPTQDGLAISESLYSFEDGNETDSKIVNPPQNCNLFGRPSLAPGIEYPLTGEEEQLLDAGYDQGYSDAMKMNRSGHLVEDDPFLEILRNRVEEIRKEKIKKGRIEPANEKELRWVQ